MKKQIMKRAWELKKQATANGIADVLFSECLREAWAEFKNGGVKMKKQLPELTGSPKQIAWAANIRDTAFKNLNLDLRVIQNRLTQKNWDCPIAEFVTGIFQNTDSVFWIDNGQYNYDAFAIWEKSINLHRDRGLKRPDYAEYQQYYDCIVDLKFKIERAYGRAWINPTSDEAVAICEKFNISPPKNGSARKNQEAWEQIVKQIGIGTVVLALMDLNK